MTTAEEVVARAEALQPMIREHAAKTEADRRVTTECIEAINQAGVFKVSVPKRYGGYELPIPSMLDASAAIGEADGSTGRSWR